MVPCIDIWYPFSSKSSNLSLSSKTQREDEESNNNNIITSNEDDICVDMDMLDPLRTMQDFKNVQDERQRRAKLSTIKPKNLKQYQEGLMAT